MFHYAKLWTEVTILLKLMDIYIQCPSMPNHTKQCNMFTIKASYGQGIHKYGHLWPSFAQLRKSIAKYGHISQVFQRCGQMIRDER